MPQTALYIENKSKISLEKDLVNLKLSCGCKGIRSCGLCEGPEMELVEAEKENQEDPKIMKINWDSESGSCTCDHLSHTTINFSGVSVIKNFVTEREEIALCNAIYNTDFVNSQSGRRKQDYGPKVNFKRKKLKLANFTGLPSYSQFLYKRMKEQEGLADFEPVELCNLEYCRDRGAHIDPHFDDSWLWGERLITLNMLSDSTLTFTSEDHPMLEVKVPLPRYSLVVVQSAARHQWKHSISRSDITGKRMAMTFRELSQEFSSGGLRESDGLELLKLALTFQGCAVGS